MGLMSAASAGKSASNDIIKVMVVDDSVVIRGLISRWVGEESSMEVCASHRNGRLAVEDVANSRPDIIVLDIEMPDMDGLTALPLLLKGYPATTIIMASTLTARNAKISLRALSLGAADYVPKPDSNSQITTSRSFRDELISKVLALGSRGKTIHHKPVVGKAKFKASGSEAQQRSVSFRAPQKRGTQGITLRPFPTIRPKALVIGSSTGGPQALEKFLPTILQVIKSHPVLITQHMPPTFTAILAEHLSKAANCEAAEGVDGEVLKKGKVYVAPGGKHMVISKSAGQVMTIKLTNDDPENFCKPAVDPLFRSAAKNYGKDVVGVILTGMGMDGAVGAQLMVDAGGAIIAQDEASSVVWGMPGAAANAGVCSAILPLDKIGAVVTKIFRGERL